MRNLGYGVWRPDAECRLVIEVKHYKTADKRRFSEVMADYADSHPDAKVLLVNYAGTGDILDVMPDVDADVRDRCHHIPHLTPATPSQWTGSGRWFLMPSAHPHHDGSVRW